MKNILTLLSALLIVTGLKAQKVTVHKETVKPKVDTLVKSKVINQSGKTVEQKGAKIAPAIKYATTSKVAPVATKAGKLAPVN
jgi:hypothetical protein